MTTGGGFMATSSGSSSTCDNAEVPGRADAGDTDPTCTVTVVVCAYTERRWPQIMRAISSVLYQQVPAQQIILVVDHNTELLRRARGALPYVEVVASAGPRGLSGARNTGVAHARGDVIAFLDDDAEAEPDWLAHLLRHYRDHSVLAVGGQAVPAWEGRRPRWLPPEFDWVVGCSFTGQPATVSPVRNVIGANMSFRRAVLERIDGFDPALGRLGRTPVGCEETELCIRLRQARPDGVVLYDPAARVRHLVSADRATWTYFGRRCLAEGRSKAVVARLVGGEAGLSVERDYTRHVLPNGVRRGLWDVGRGDGAGLLRSAAIVAGLLITATGYGSEYALRTARSAMVPAEPAPVRVLEVELAAGVPDVPDVGGPGAAGRYGDARVLVRLHGQPLGQLDVDLPAGGLTAHRLAEIITQRLSRRVDAHLRADNLPLRGSAALVAGVGGSCPSSHSPVQVDPFVSVVVPTCGRRSLLKRTLESLCQLDYPRFEVVVVDNAPRTPATADLVRQVASGDARVRYVSEPISGVTYARNRGLAEANGEIVAFADDDVIVDRLWLRALVDGFVDEDIAGVTGFVLAGELDTPAQVWMERYGGFGKGCQRKRFDRTGFDTVSEGTVHRSVAGPGSLYPYLPGGYGSGANMAFRAKVVRELGGFDPLLGSGGAVRTGEDIDLLMRLVLAGHALVYEPAAIVWHTHRVDPKAMRRVVFCYGVGLTAVLAKCLVADRARRWELLRRVPRGIRYALAPHSTKNSGKRAGYPVSLSALELCGMALGPACYAAAGWSARARRRSHSASMPPPGRSEC